MFGSFEIDCPVCQVEQDECQGKQQPEKNMIMHRYKTKQKHTMPLSGLSCNCQAQPQLQLSWAELALILQNPRPTTHPTTHPSTTHPPRIVVRRPNITILKCVELNQDQMDRLN